MAAVDHETIIVTRFWEIFEAHAPLAITTTADSFVKPGARIKLLGNAARPPVKIDPNAFPKVIASIPQSADSLYTLSERYAMGPAGSFNPLTNGVVCDLQFNLVISVIPDKDFTTARMVVAEIMTALRKAGPNLGIAEFRAQRIGPATISNRLASAVDGDNIGVSGARPLDTQINLPILVRQKTTDLIS